MEKGNKKECLKCKEATDWPTGFYVYFGKSDGWCKKCHSAAATANRKNQNINRKNINDIFMVKEDWEAFKAAERNPFMLLFWEFVTGCALRVTEALQATQKDFNGQRGTFIVHVLKMKGCRRLEVETVVKPDVLQAILKLPKDVDGRYFTFTRHAAWRRFKTTAKRAGLKAGLSPHSLRHYAGIRASEMTNGNAFKTAQALRHVGVDNVSRYVNFTDKQRKEIQEQMWEGV